MAQPNKLRVYVVETGDWKFDRTSGKQLMLFELEDKDGNTISYCPYEEEIINMVRWWLKAEGANDIFEQHPSDWHLEKRPYFYDIRDKKYYRPPQFKRKLRILLNLLGEEYIL